MSKPSDESLSPAYRGLSLAPFKALRFVAEADELGDLLCPPYDVIDVATRTELLRLAPDNAVQLILPELDGTDPALEHSADPYESAAEKLQSWVESGRMAVDRQRALYVYEMTTASGDVTRGLLGAVELRAYDDGVILPHENTMAGPVADRLALMAATEANLEPIYLVYDGGGTASEVVADVDGQDPIATATTPDGVTHRLWAITDPAVHVAVETDLSRRRALIADGHHRYATYLELQRQLRSTRGPGSWDRGLTLLVDSSSYGPQVHAIHRVLNGVSIVDAIELARGVATVRPTTDPENALIDAPEGFAIVLTDGSTSAIVTDPSPDLLASLREEAAAAHEPAALADLDVTIVHRGLVPKAWNLHDDESTVGYAHSIEDAIAQARTAGGTAVLMRPTPVDAVTAVAAAGARMPRKSTLFTPKPASGLVLSRFIDQFVASA